MSALKDAAKTPHSGACVLDELGPVYLRERVGDVAGDGVHVHERVARLFRKPPGAVTGLLLVMVVLAVAARLALAGFMSGRTNSMYHSRASKFAKPIQEFFHDHGCYPASVEDLCGRAPTYGLDPSGNKVPLRGATARYYIGEIPLDPITRSRTTWRIDLASPELVTSTAFKTTVTLEGNVP